MQSDELLNQHNSIPQTVLPTTRNENSLIVEKFNPIWHSHPVHHGTKF